MFRPILPHQPGERIFLSRALSGADHHWVIADPLCSVEGSIRIGSRSDAGATDRQIAFTGRGYHDHNYGTAPIGPGLKRWFWGRVLFDDRMVTFHYARARDASLPDEVHIVAAGPEGQIDLAPKHCDVVWDRRTPLGLAYPSAARFDSILELSNPRLVDSAPFYMRLVYDAVVDGRRGTAFCEAAYPHRLRWPVLGRMIEMSIEKTRH